MEELPPEDCLIRLCRLCHKPMELHNYEWDTMYRWYTFFCDMCVVQSTVGEMINYEFREQYEDQGVILEPLTEEEKRAHNEIKIKDFND